MGEISSHNSDTGPFAIFTLLSVMVAVSSGCGQEGAKPPLTTDSAYASGEKVSSDRWYRHDQVIRGEPLFQTHCAVCHREDASGTPNWRQADAAGNFPPPPLNGTAHTWHHPLEVLRRTVRIGGIPLGGSMPAFESQLNAEQIDDILAWVQSHWSDRIYALWRDRDNQANRQLQPMPRN